MNILAFYLPQFHPIAENDKWWGPGFTEWRNVARARPLFPRHSQPKLPGELGFYDLRLNATMEKQAELAAWAGIAGFCFYHYWFAGKLLLETPVESYLANRNSNLPFCLCWANHTWTGHWAGRDNEIYVEQIYPGAKDDLNHYRYLRSFFSDIKYFRIRDKPVFAVFHPSDLPDPAAFVDRIKTWAIEDGFTDLFLVGMSNDERLLNAGFDALAPHSLNLALENYLQGPRTLYHKLKHHLLGFPRWVIDYATLSNYFPNNDYDGITRLPTVVPNWDNTPRVERRGLVLSNSSPDKFAEHLYRSTEGFVKGDFGSEQILLLKSWNEWAEGNYIEPDLDWGRGWLDVVRQFVADYNSSRRRDG